MDAERDGLKKSVARCGYHNPSLVRRDSTLPQRGLMPCPSMGSRKAVAAGEQGDGGGRGDRDAYNYDRTGTAPVLARTTDLLAANVRALQSLSSLVSHIHFLSCEIGCTRCCLDGVVCICHCALKCIYPVRSCLFFGPRMVLVSF